MSLERRNESGQGDPFALPVRFIRTVSHGAKRSNVSANPFEFWVIRGERTPLDSQGTLEKSDSLGIVPLGLAQRCQRDEYPGYGRVIWPECALLYRQGTLEQRFGLGILRLLKMNACETLEAERHVRVVGPEPAFPNGQRALVQRLSLGVPAFFSSELGEVGEAGCHVRVIASECAFTNLQMRARSGAEPRRIGPPPSGCLRCC